MPGHGRRQGSCRPWPILRHQLALLPVLLPKACTFDASDLGGWEPEAISAAAAPPRATARAAAGCPAHPAGRQTTDAQETGAQRPARAPTAPRQGAGARNLRPARQGVQAGALPVGPMVGRALLQRPPSLNPDLRASRVDHIAGHDLTSHQPDHIPEVADLHITAQQRHPIAPAGVQQVALHIRRPAPSRQFRYVPCQPPKGARISSTLHGPSSRCSIQRPWVRRSSRLSGSPAAPL
jgi:hypothetical protein